MASAAAGHGTIKVHEVAIPFSIDATTAALTAWYFPRSSQFTMSTRASGGKPSSSLDRTAGSTGCGSTAPLSMRFVPTKTRRGSRFRMGNTRFGMTMSLDGFVADRGGDVGVLYPDFQAMRQS